jgi:Secretin and TonB N terminus short domain
MKRTILILMLMSLGTAARARADDPEALLTQGKLDVDMGDGAAAAAAFEGVIADPAAPSLLRGEALVRLGLVRKSAGDEKGASEAFALAWRDHRQEKDVVALLLQALGQALPGDERWDAIWRQVVVRIPGTRDDEPPITVEWPGVPLPRVRGVSGPLGRSDDSRPLPQRPSANRVVSRTAVPGFTEGPKDETPHHGITLDFKNGDVQDLARLFADITQLNVVVHPGVQGFVTLKMKDVPWEDALERILAPNGYAASRVDNVLEIAEPRYLPSARRFEGAPVDLDFHEVELVDALRQVAAHGARSVTADSQVAGHMTLKLWQVPWDQAFDLIARLNGLKWEQDGTTLKVGPR